MTPLERKRYSPSEDVPAVPPLEGLQRAQAILEDLEMPEQLGRAPDHEHHMRESSYLSEVWEAFRLSVNEKQVLEVKVTQAE